MEGVASFFTNTDISPPYSRWFSRQEVSRQSCSGERLSKQREGRVDQSPNQPDKPLKGVSSTCDLMKQNNPHFNIDHQLLPLSLNPRPKPNGRRDSCSDSRERVNLLSTKQMWTLQHLIRDVFNTNTSSSRKTPWMFVNNINHVIFLWSLFMVQLSFVCRVKRNTSQIHTGYFGSQPLSKP